MELKTKTKGNERPVIGQREFTPETFIPGTFIPSNCPWGFSNNLLDLEGVSVPDAKQGAFGLFLQEGKQEF